MKETTSQEQHRFILGKTQQKLPQYRYPKKGKKVKPTRRSKT